MGRARGDVHARRAARRDRAAEAASARPPGTPGAPSPSTGRGPLLLTLLLAAASALVQLWLVRDLRQLPSALFGGDWTYQEACIRAFLATGNPLASPAGPGAMPGYMPLYTWCAGLAVRLTGLPVDRVMLLLSAVNHAFAALAAYALVAPRLGARTAFVMACLWEWTSVSLFVKYTEFAAAVLVPFYFGALLAFLESPQPRRALALGLVLAVLGYAHAVAFTGGIAIAGLSSLAAVWLRPTDRPRGAELRATLLGWLIVAACSLLALGYWYRPLFVLHGRTSLHYSEWNGGELMRTLHDRLAFMARLLVREVAGGPGGEPAGPGRLLLRALALIGLVQAVRSRGARGSWAGALALIATLVWMAHFFVTFPLLGMHLVPEYVRTMLLACAWLPLAAFPVAALADRVRAGRSATVAGAAVLFATIGALTVDARALRQSPDMVDARLPLPPYYLELQRWALAQTGPDAMLLSNNELGYAWSGLTGRPAFVSRRAQNDPFLDLDVRNKDAALMLYGRSDSVRAGLLGRWRIQYFLWSRDWIPLEFGRGGVPNDPLLYFANPDYDAELARDSVQFRYAYTWVDPYLRGEAFPKFDLSIVTPGNYWRRNHPWSPRLDAYLEPVWSYREGSDTLAALWRVRGVNGRAAPSPR